MVGAQVDLLARVLVKQVTQFIVCSVPSAVLLGILFQQQQLPSGERPAPSTCCAWQAARGGGEQCGAGCG